MEVSAQAGLVELARLASEPRVRVYGAEGALQALTIAHLAKSGPLVAVTPTEAEAAQLVRDLGFFMPAVHSDDILGSPRVLHLPHQETAPWADVSPDRRAILRRMSALFRLSQGLAGEVLVASAAALARRVIPRASYTALVDVLQSGETIDRDRTVQILVRGGYSRAPVVEDAGTFAVRGGVVDVFVPLYRFPLRLELDGDQVESIRFFDPETQRTMRQVDEVYLHPVRETVLTEGNRLRERLLDAGDLSSHPSAKTRALLDQIDKGEDFFGIEALTPAFHAGMSSIAEYLPAEPRFFISDPDGCQEAVEDEWADGEEAYQARMDEHRLAFPVGDFYLPAEDFSQLLSRGRRVEAEQLEVAGRRFRRCG